jgi:hypothetical protein
MAQDDQITGHWVSTQGPFLTMPGALKAVSPACEYLAGIAALNGPTPFIGDKPKHIVTITGAGQAVSWPLSPNSRVRSEMTLPFCKRAFLLPKILTSNHQVLLGWTPRTKNNPSHALPRQVGRPCPPDNIYQNMTANKDNIPIGHIPMPATPVLTRSVHPPKPRSDLLCFYSPNIIYRHRPTPIK